jgi:hypothetical protein
MKRVTWFAAGAVAGASGSVYARHKMREAAERYKPVSMAKGAVQRLADAVREGRSAMTAKEAELRARQDAAPPGPLGDGDRPPTVPLVVVDTTDLSSSHRAPAGPRRRGRR